MSSLKEYVATRHIRHGEGKKHITFPKGKLIPAGTFSDRDEANLLAAGALAEPTAANVTMVREYAPLLTLDELEKFSGPQLVAYAQGRGVTLTTTTKAEMISEISQSVQAGAALQVATDQAQAEGRL